MTPGLIRAVPQSELFPTVLHGCSYEASAAKLTFKEAGLLRKQVQDWKIEEAAGGDLLLRCGDCLRTCLAGAVKHVLSDNAPRRRVWAAKDATSAKGLLDAVLAIGSKEGHKPSKAAAEDSGNVTLEFSGPSGGGLTVNDFIIADRIERTDLSSFLPPKRKAKIWV